MFSSGNPTVTVLSSVRTVEAAAGSTTIGLPSLPLRLYGGRHSQRTCSPGCPLELLAPGQNLMEALNMQVEDARAGSKQLYREIRLEAGPTRPRGTVTIIGITYDLRDEYLAEGYGEEETAEFDRPDTIDAIAAALRELGHEVDRIGRARQLVERLAAGRSLGSGVQYL